MTSRQFRQTAAAWLPEIPCDWSMVPAKALFANRNEMCRANDVHLTPSQRFGVVSQEDYMQLSGSSVVLNLSGADRMKHVEEGDFVSHLRSFQGGLERSSLSGKVSAAYTVLAPRDFVVGSFFRYLLKCDRYVEALRVTTDQLRDGQSIRYKEFGGVPLPLPSVATQLAISEFLDRETSQIDAMIQAQRTLVDRLDERRRATVLSAIRGHGKDWEARPLKHFVRRIAGSGFPVDEQGVEGLALPFYKVNALGRAQTDGRIRDVYDTVDRFTARRLGAKIVPAGSSVMAKIGAAVLLGRVRQVAVDCCLDNNMVGFAPTPLINERFAYYALQQFDMRFFINPGTLPFLNERSLLSTPIPVPGLDEQCRVASELDQVTAREGEMIQAVYAALDFMYERRSALISAAVTGRIDPRTGEEFTTEKALESV